MGRYKGLSQGLSLLADDHYTGEVERHATFHAWVRFYQRYGQTLTRTIIREIKSKIKSSRKSQKRYGGDVQRAKAGQSAWRHSSNLAINCHWTVLVDGIGLVRFVYNTRRKKIITFTPRASSINSPKRK